jgi:glycolate oxidase
MLSNVVKEKLISIVSKANFDDSKTERLVYSYDATPNFQAMPDAVISPRNTEEVSEILKVCNQYKVPIVPRGSGTNLCAEHARPRAVLSFFSNI